MSLFDATRAFLVLTRELEAHERQHAERFAISIVSSKGLDQWIDRLPDTGFRAPGFLTDWLRLENGISGLSSGLQQLVTFRKYGFWQAEPNQSILQTVRVVAAAVPKLQSGNPFHRALVLDVAAMLSLSLLRLAHAVFYVPEEDFTSAARSYLFGGTRALRLREQLLERMRTAIATASRSDGELSLDPPYMPELLEIARRLAQRPLDARLMPHQFVAALYRIGPDAGELSVPQKLAWDVLRFLVRASGLPEQFASVFGTRKATPEQLRIDTRDSGVPVSD